MKMIKRLPGYKPLAVTERSLILARGRQLFTADLDLNNLVPLATLPARRFKHRFSSLRAADRLLRLSVSTAIVTPGKTVFAATGSEIWRIDLKTKEVSLDFEIPQGRKSLNLSYFETLGSQTKVIVFGDYFPNQYGPMLRRGIPAPDAPSVQIWVRSTSGAQEWSVLDSFEGDTIDHIHNLIADSSGQRVFALIGDTGPGVGFWEWSEQSTGFVPFQTGRQVNRSVWAIADRGELIYATDTQLEQNYLMKSQLQSQANPEKIAKIDGTSIYSGRTANCMVFSTSIEPGKPSGNFVKDLFERKPGPGINGTEAKIYSFDLKLGQLSEVFSAQKDAVPLRLGQFGSFMFPTGMEQLEDRFFAYGNAVKGFENECLLFQ